MFCFSGCITSPRNSMVTQQLMQMKANQQKSNSNLITIKVKDENGQVCSIKVVKTDDGRFIIPTEFIKVNYEFCIE